MPKYRRYNWPHLLSEFEKSELTQVEFCKQHNVNPKYFSIKLSERKKAQAKQAFATVVVQPHKEPTQPQPLNNLIIEIGQCKIHCPTTMPTPNLVALVKSLI
ncbi:IS66 family insertion sequence element accessory protein TnpA [Marinibactrum halimedae]|uniref:Transposase n=1 Tax=Marinibactrum halimedae TaxID=1444977 RepID=A0AA37WJU5_9GAMM|nr:hypothetical protein [Marinibactrum halimedae]MCD9461030.1 hypothetical protein [Marinibactrum halimedae]GLS24408.1 hypothetical protein GCM10007877_01190 [Marinibactrum halimedae]